MKVIIGGAGITGLAVGYYLQQKGIDFEIYEESHNPSLSTTGIQLASYCHFVFKIWKSDENTVYGYNVGIDISESMVLVYKARYSYKFDGIDSNGDSIFKQVYSMFVETQVLF